MMFEFFVCRRHLFLCKTIYNQYYSMKVLFLFNGLFKRERFASAESV